MKSTNLFAEIIVTGFFGMIWLIIFISIFEPKLLSLLFQISSTIDSVLIVFVLFIFLYQIGWLISWLSFISFELWGSYIKKKIFSSHGVEYENIRPYVYHNASFELRNDLGVDRMVVRMSRGGFFNFVLISIGLIFLKVDYLYIMITFLLSLIFGAQGYFRYKRYYRRLMKAYLTLKGLGQVT